jgi:copper chaperone CopZ
MMRMELDASGWSGEGEFTQRIIAALENVSGVQFVKVEDAPASRADDGFSFISNELFVGFASAPRVVRGRKLGFIPASTVVEDKLMTLPALESTLSAMADVGPPDYSDDGMLQYLRSERIVPAYQTRGYKLIELVRIYEARTNLLTPSSRAEMKNDR